MRTKRSSRVFRNLVIGSSSGVGKRAGLVTGNFNPFAACDHSGKIVSKRRELKKNTPPLLLTHATSALDLMISVYSTHNTLS